MARPVALATRETREIVALENDCAELGASLMRQDERDRVEAAELHAHHRHVTRYYPHDRSLQRWADWFLTHNETEDRYHAKHRTLAERIAARWFRTDLLDEKDAPLVGAREASEIECDNPIIRRAQPSDKGAA